MGALYATFAAAPAILMSDIGLTPIQYGLFSAATVFVVFGADMAVPRLVRRLGAPRSAMIGATFAAVGGAILLAGCGPHRFRPVHVAREGYRPKVRKLRVPWQGLTTPHDSRAVSPYFGERCQSFCAN